MQTVENPGEGVAMIFGKIPRGSMLFGQNCIQG